jgi:putative endonuclease
MFQFRRVAMDASGATEHTPTGFPECADRGTRWAHIRDLYPVRNFTILATMSELIEKPFYVYMTASKPRGVIYTGLTTDLSGRAYEHRARVLDGFTKRYWAGRLVYFERHATAAAAQRREWLMKRWRRDWKIELIETGNPTWRDLFLDVLRLDGFEA